MPIDHIENLEPGFSVRTKLNTVIDSINAGTGGGADPRLDDHLIDFANPHQVSHVQVTGKGANDHHNQVHDFLGSDHNDVSAAALSLQEGLFWDGAELSGDYRVKGKLYAGGSTYYEQDMVYQDGYLMIANKQTTDYPAPQESGEPFFPYDALGAVLSQNAKQMISGHTYIFADPVYISKINLYQDTGQSYDVYGVEDPSGSAIQHHILSTGAAAATGWTVLSIPTMLVAGTWDFASVTSEPDVTPTTFNANYNYQTPQANSAPASGVILHSRDTIDVMNISKTDNDAGSPAIASLGFGDRITAGDVIWTIQSVNDLGSYIAFGVSPAVQNSVGGVLNFTFETVSSTPLFFVQDTDHWLGHASISGFKARDVPYASRGLTDDAYGIDIEVQEISQSDDWDIFGLPALAGGSGGGSGAHVLDFHDDVTITGPVNQQALVYDGAGWVNTTLPSGVTDHGALTGLADDDHGQYLNNARGDARYPGIGDYNTHVGDTDIHYADAPVNSSQYARVNNTWAIVNIPTQDHGGLTGLVDDDHSQYHTDARGDARYPAIADYNSHVGDGTIHFADALANGNDYVRNNNAWVVASGGGVTDHGALTGLSDDDHAQYHTDARGDARYPLISHTHGFSDIPIDTGTTGGNTLYWQSSNSAWQESSFLKVNPATGDYTFTKDLTIDQKLAVGKTLSVGNQATIETPVAHIGTDAVGVRLFEFTALGIIQVINAAETVWAPLHLQAQDITFSIETTPAVEINADGSVGGIFLHDGAIDVNHKIEVVTTLPGTPDADTLYFVTT